MPKELTNDVDDIEEMADDVTDGADASQEEEQSAAAAASSDADDSKKPAEKDTMSLVRDVVDEDDKSDEAAASSAGEDEGQEEEDGSPEQDDENYSDVPFNKHPRFQQILRRMKEAEIDAVRARNIQEFIDQNYLQAEEVKELIEVGGLIKTNPVEAWKRIQPVVQNILRAAGEILPDELKAKVDAGELTRETALQISRSNAAARTAADLRTFEQRHGETRQQQDAARAIHSAVSDWEAARRARDPNFDAKQPALEREIAWIHAKEGKAKTAEDAKRQLQRAYDNVSKTFAPAASPERKPAKRPVTGGQVNGHSREQRPQSTMDIIRAEIAKSQGAAA